VLRASHPRGHPELAYVLRDYGFILLDRQRWVEAEAVWREAAPMLRRFLGERSLAHINALSCLGRSLSAQGRNSEAVPLLREAVSLHQQVRPGGSPILTRAQLFLGSALTAQGAYDEAERHLLAAQGGSIPPELRRVTERIILQSLVDLYDARGDAAAAARYRARLGPSTS
jgi:tetratricopeptide (TPR) repeat protein